MITMNQQQKRVAPPVQEGMHENFGRAVDEIRLKRNIEKLTHLINSFERSRRPQYLIDEIACQERKLEHIRKQRSA